MIAGKKYNGLEVDLWSCGVILFAMVCGTLPFEVHSTLLKDPNTSLLYKKILTLNYKIPSDISSFAKDILKNLLTTNAKRLGLVQIRAHEFYRLYNHPPSQGILVGRHNIPVDSNILA
jgi:5'-AMP-activated protein kinase, catalytic alpha subunit